MQIINSNRSKQRPQTLQLSFAFSNSALCDWFLWLVPASQQCKHSYSSSNFRVFEAVANLSASFKNNNTPHLPMSDLFLFPLYAKQYESAEAAVDAYCKTLGTISLSN